MFRKELELEPYFELVCKGFRFISWLSVDAIFPDRDAWQMEIIP